METFYDGDLKDIWDSDLDPTESLKISADHDMNDWFLERDVKESAVILNDRLISDALLNGTFPIKTEHSYSLNSDGDSLPDSPRSLQTKMDDIDDECYPAISLKTATSNLRSSSSCNATIDPKCLTLHSPATLNCTLAVGANRVSNSLLTPATTLIGHQQHQTTSFGSLTNGNLTLNLRSLEQQHGIGSVAKLPLDHKSNQQHHHQQQQQQQLQQQQQQHHHHHQHHQHLPQKFSIMFENDCSSSVSTREGSISPDICSDIEIDESCIKDEPLSPNSSCPASPNSENSDTSAPSLHFTTDDFLKCKNGGLQLSNSQHFTKSQQQQQQQQQQQHYFLGSAQTTTTTTTNNNPNSVLMSKINIKCEKQQHPAATTTTSTAATATPPKNTQNAYGIPLTPPSSLPSDESEGNLTPEHLFSPLSPNSSVSMSTMANGNGSLLNQSGETMSRRINTNNAGASSNGGRTTSATSTRQPIHTPLISTQPKGSTGTLILTEEEKRTLLAEGYPIPQKLPLTKAEEKSLKKIRRKIKNKISAQESRRKKKEYMDQLERRVEILVSENNDFKKRVESLEDTNASLLSQLHNLQALVNKQQNVKKA